MIWSDVEKVHAELKAERAREERRWRDLARLLDEDGEVVTVQQTDANVDGDNFDSTPLYAKDDFVGGLFTDAINPADRWYDYTIEDKDLSRWGPVAKYLWARADRVFSTLDPSTSGFYTQASPWFGDLAMIGTGFLWQEENVGRNALIEKALPFREMFKSVDAGGATDRIHREFYLTDRQAKGWFKDRAPVMSTSSKALFVHTMYQNPEFRPGALGPRGKPWASCYVSPEKRDFSFETPGFFELPVHEIQWKQRSGRAWATGPGHKALADMRFLDEGARSELTALQFEAEPIMLLANEDIATAADIVPNALLYGGLTDAGKRQAEYLQRGDNLNYPLAKMERIRSAVREAFYFSIFQLMNRPQMTATEFTGFREEKLRVLAPHLVCLQRGLGSFIARRDRILERAGAFADLPPPAELQGQPIKLKFTSPFAQAQKATKARAALQLGTSVMQLQPLKPDIADTLEMDNLVRQIHDGLSGDPGLVRDPRAVEKIRADRAAQLQQQAQLEQAAQAASVVADVSHAQQASSLARGRGRP